MDGAPIPVEVTPEIIELARWAVDEHNKIVNCPVEFKKVLSAKKQVVNGYNCYLTLEAANELEKIDNLYEATVYVSWDDNVKELTAFNIINPTPGGLYPIDVTPKVMDLGRFAVHEHNNKEYTRLEFKSVWSAKEQIVEGSYYYLTLQAADAGKNNVYEATVFVSLKHVKELQEFKLIPIA